MIDKEVSKQILTVGCKYRPPKGGIAQVMYNYECYVFPIFKCIVNSGAKSKAGKLLKAIIAWIRMLGLLFVDRNIRIVHIHTASYNSFRRSVYFVRLGKLFGKKVVLHIHGGGFKEYFTTNPKRISKNLDLCDSIVTLSQSWQMWFQERKGKSKVEVIENIIPKPLMNRESKCDDFVHVLFLGLITKQKGIFDLLQVLANHKDDFEGKLRLHIGGNGEVEVMNDFVTLNGLENIVQYEGWVNEEKKAELFSIADAFILPSYVEGLPISILEAMSFNVPVIATKVGGIPEVISDKRDGLLIEPGDCDAIYRILFELISNPISISCLVGEASKKIQKHYPDAVSKRLGKLYQSLL